MKNESLNQQHVIVMVQQLLLSEEDNSVITPALITEKINMVVTLNPKWGIELNREAVKDELIRRFSLWTGQDTILKSDTGHESWLNMSRKKDWRYWQRYREFLEISLSWKAVEALNKTTDEILGLLEDPIREKSWDRRGLVVGHVQSGKTANYTGLICKAADAGYKIIIVLAGLHNNLRSQTQIRLDEGFLGFATISEYENAYITGVGLIDGDPNIRPNYATNRSEKGDFNRKVAKNLGITPEERPWLFVVKKNKAVLELLYQWIKKHVANSQDPITGRKLVTNLPLLIIDDEADNASVDTGEVVFDNEGNPDENHHPTAINSRIRKILNSFSRSAYVGYTATPFANIFIHEKGETKEEGPDLFPSSFIINLSAPSNYIGPVKLFGKKDLDDTRTILPLVRFISDFADEDPLYGWMPLKHRNGHIPLYNGSKQLPPTLMQAIDSFILVCAARFKRGDGNKPSSMLVHVTRFNSVQNEVFEQIEEYVFSVLQRITRNIDNEAILNRLELLWNNDFVPTTNVVNSLQADCMPSKIIQWKEILEILPDIIADIQIKMINGTAKDSLDYADHVNTGLKVIAIGGDKLSRGLTLEGLSVSYFLRASKMYDTLMQMGRWFGYRSNYLDLCRLFTTEELFEWFGHITDASEELREEFDLMAASGATPRDYGLKVQSHPVLLVTSRLKMRAAKDLLISFSGELLETIVFHKQNAVITNNLKALNVLINSMSVFSEKDPVRRNGKGKQSWKGFLWKNIKSDFVIDFLETYNTHPESYKVKSNLIAEFIRSLNLIGELINWTVVLIGSDRGKGENYTLENGNEITMLARTNNRPYDDRYSIKRLISPRDESIDLDELTWNAALKKTIRAWKPDPTRIIDGKVPEPPETPSGVCIRDIRGFGEHDIKPTREKGLLLLYVLDPLLANAGFTDETPPLVAFGISFPGSNSGTKVKYKVNHVQWKEWEQNYDSVE